MRYDRNEVKILKRLLVVCLLMGLLVACGQQRFTAEHFAMDTYIHLTVVGGQEEAGAQACFAYLDALEQEVSISGTGQIAQLNQEGEGLLEGDARILVELALRYAQQTQGAFDPTLLALKHFWTDGQGTLEEALAQTGYQRIAYTEGKIALNGVAGLDLGGIAKGYAGDVCMDLLRQHGVQEAVLNLGGNVAVMGDRTFRIGIRDPHGSAGESVGVISVTQGNVVTSGAYERFIMVDGEARPHILDGKTGLPADSGILSATAICKDGALADAAATAMFVMGVEEALAFAERAGIDAILITDDQKIYLTDGCKASFELFNTQYEVQ